MATKQGYGKYEVSTITRVVEEDVTRGYIVTSGANEAGALLPTSSGAQPVGAVTNSTSSGLNVPLAVLGHTHVVAGGAITYGNPVYLGSGGTVLSSGNKQVGVALETASASGEEILVDLRLA